MPGPSGNKNGPFFRQVVKNDDDKYALGNSFKNLGEIRFFL